MYLLLWLSLIDTLSALSLLGWILAILMMFALGIVLYLRRSGGKETQLRSPIYAESDNSEKESGPPKRIDPARRIQPKEKLTTELQPQIDRYDAFLSYNREDQLDVRSIYDYLTERGLTIWLDITSIGPGDDWLEAMESGLSKSSCCIVFYRNEPGVWQKEETKAAIRKRAEDTSFKVIPVLLPGTTESDPQLPSFLKGTTWVDLRAGLFNVDALKRLVKAIRSGHLVTVYEAEADDAENSELPGGYRADVRKIISLLIGESLYSRRDVSIRELIQNSVDACERKGNIRFGSESRASVTVNIDTRRGFFEVIDNGDGMTPLILSEYFAVIGKSIKDEENVLERVQGDEKTRLRLISRFGIGFVSVYMLAKRVLISTTAEGHEQINLEMKGVSDSFVYYESSEVRRHPELIGTTVRVELREAFLEPGETYLDVLASVEEFCRHVQFVKIIKDGRKIALKQTWNTESAIISNVTASRFKFELHLGLSKTNLDLFASGAGFLISRNPDAIMPAYMPAKIGGEINFYPSVIDLNMARDTIVPNEKSREIRNEISRALRELLITATSENKEEVREELRDLFIAYLVEAEKIEQRSKSVTLRTKNTAGEVSSREIECPPVSSAEAAELLLDVWFVQLYGKDCSFREALEIIKKDGRYRVYSANYYLADNSLAKIIRDSLSKRGFLVVPLKYASVSYKSGRSDYVNSKDALTYLSKRYFFDLYDVEAPLQSDVTIAATLDDIPPFLKNVISEVEQSVGQQIPLANLAGAPIVFELAGSNYLNIGNGLLQKAESTFARYDPTVLRSYLLGLLQYEIQ